MGELNYQRTVIAYDGCDESVLNAILLRGEALAEGIRRNGVASVIRALFQPLRITGSSSRLVREQRLQRGVLHPRSVHRLPVNGV